MNLDYALLIKPQQKRSNFRLEKNVCILSIMDTNPIVNSNCKFQWTRCDVPWNDFWSIEYEVKKNCLDAVDNLIVIAV